MISNSQQAPGQPPYYTSFVQFTHPAVLRTTSHLLLCPQTSNISLTLPLSASDFASYFTERTEKLEENVLTFQEPNIKS